MTFTLPLPFKEPVWSRNDAPEKFWLATTWNASIMTFSLAYPLEVALAP
jgi:hypothetical protein